MNGAKLNPAAKALLEEPVIANLATVGDDGSPHVTPVWVDVDGDDVVINTVEGRAKTRNLRRSATVAISVVDPADPFRVVALQGSVADITTEDADAHIAGWPASTSASTPTRCASRARSGSRSASAPSGC